MKVGIYSHCTIDSIVHGDNVYDVPGGPACYCSLTARNQKFNVTLSTKYGIDFPLIEFLVVGIFLEFQFPYAFTPSLSFL